GTGAAAADGAGGGSGAARARQAVRSEDVRRLLCLDTPEPGTWFLWRAAVPTALQCAQGCLPCGRSAQGGSARRWINSVWGFQICSDSACPLVLARRPVGGYLQSEPIEVDVLALFRLAEAAALQAEAEEAPEADGLAGVVVAVGVGVALQQPAPGAALA